MMGVSYEPTPGSFAAWAAQGLDVTMVDLYTITTQTGAVYLYSGADAAITQGARTWILGPGIERSRLRRTIGLSVDNLKLKVYADSRVTLGGINYLAALKNGAWTNADVLLEIAYIDKSGVIQGIVPKFAGKVGSVGPITRAEAQVEVRSAADLLSVMVPGEVYQPMCRNTLGDGLCGIALSSLQITTAAASVTDSTRRVVNVTGSGSLATSGWATLGQITMTSGANAGATRGIALHVANTPTSSTITTLRPWDYAIASGDTCTIQPGCAKTMAACSGFSNLAKFRGEPFVPAPETIV